MTTLDGMPELAEEDQRTRALFRQVHLDAVGLDHAVFTSDPSS